MVIDIGVAVMLRSKTLVPKALSVSVAFAVKLNGPLAVGVPESTPAVLSDMPAGIAPAETVQVNGEVPPVAARVCDVYATFCDPAGSGELVVTVIGAAAMLRANTLEPVAESVSVASAVKLNAPEAVGVPESTPAVLKLMPGGSVPPETVQVNGAVPPVAAKV